MLCLSYHGLRLSRLGGLVKPPKGAVISSDGIERLGNDLSTNRSGMGLQRWMQMNPYWGLDNNVCCVKIEGTAALRDKVRRTPKFWSGDTRDKGGMTQTRANLWNRRSCFKDVKGEWREAYFGKSAEYRYFKIVADCPVVATTHPKNGQGNPGFSEGGNGVRLNKSYNLNFFRGWFVYYNQGLNR